MVPLYHLKRHISPTQYAAMNVTWCELLKTGVNLRDHGHVCGYQLLLVQIDLSKSHTAKEICSRACSDTFSQLLGKRAQSLQQASMFVLDIGASVYNRQTGVTSERAYH